MSVKLREYEVVYLHDGNAYTLPVWVATAGAAREAAEAYALQTHGADFKVRSVRLVAP